MIKTRFRLLTRSFPALFRRIVVGLIIGLWLIEKGINGSPPDFYHRLSEAALELTAQHVVYDPSYYAIDYPNGDVPSDKGVCTDVIIRAYRKLEIDLQQRVHQDILAERAAYPRIWGPVKPDHNIDHRRVPNLMTFFTRHGKVLPITHHAEDYSPGDIVCWNLSRGITHIGIVVNRYGEESEVFSMVHSDSAGSGPSAGRRNLIVHNIGAGQVVEDCLFSNKIIGHYRYP